MIRKNCKLKIANCKLQIGLKPKREREIRAEMKRLNAAAARTENDEQLEAIVSDLQKLLTEARQSLVTSAATEVSK
jgi:hypothetical protein